MTEDMPLLGPPPRPPTSSCSRSRPDRGPQGFSRAPVGTRPPAVCRSDPVVFLPAGGPRGLGCGLMCLSGDFLRAQLFAAAGPGPRLAEAALFSPSSSRSGSGAEGPGMEGRPLHPEQRLPVGTGHPARGHRVLLHVAVLCIAPLRTRTANPKPGSLLLQLSSTTLPENVARQLETLLPDTASPASAGPSVPGPPVSLSSTCWPPSPLSPRSPACR